MFFDIALSTDSPHDDAIALSLREAREQGMPVGVPVRLQGERPVKPASVAIAEAAELGVVEARQDSVFLHVRAIPTRLRDQAGAAAKKGSFAGKAVVVGVVGAPQDSHRTPGGVRSGAEIEAGVVQVLLRQAGVKRVAPEWDALFAGVLGIGTWALGVRLRPHTWLAALVPAAGAVVFVALAAANQVLAPGPALLAVVLAVVLLRTRGRTPS